MLSINTHIDESAFTGTNDSASARNPIFEALVSAVVELNIARKTSLAYPSGHVQLVRSIERACLRVHQILEQLPELTLQIKRDGIHWQDSPLNSKNDAVGEYAGALYRMSIHTVTFLKGLNDEDLTRFHQLLGMEPEAILNAGGIQKVFTEAGFDFIRVQEIDYNSYRLIEGDNIQKAGADEKGEDGAGGFRFLKNLFSRILSKSDGDDRRDKDGAPGHGPRQIAQLLNEGRLETDRVLESYDQFLTEQIALSNAESSEGQRRAAILDDLDVLLKNLKPGLRQQFLSVTFNRLGDANDSGIKEEVLGGLSDEMVIEMLRLANEENKEISPALIRLVQKMSGTRSDSVDSSLGNDSFAEIADELPEISVEEMKQLFEREKYESYVDAEYDSLLKRIAGVRRAHIKPIEAFDLKRQIRTFREEHIDRQVNQMLIAMLDDERDPEVYQTFSQTVLSGVSKMLDRGDFKFLLRIIATFNRHKSENPNKEIRVLADRSLGILHKPQFLSEAAAAFEKWSGEKGFEIGDLYLAIGTRRISRLIDLYGRNAYRGDLDALLSVLAGFGPVVLDDVYSRLKDPRGDYVLNMVHLIGAIGNRQSLPHLKKLLTHEDPVVRFATLEIFLKFKDATGIIALKNALASESPTEFALAAALAGDYRVAAVVPELLAMIKTKPLRKSDFNVNEILIRALGKIGHASALPTLEKLVLSKWSLHRGRLSKMKEVVYESLDRYPYESIRTLINSGETSDNPRIQQLCAGLVGRQFHAQRL